MQALEVPSTCCFVQFLKMSFREPDLMDSHIHCASSTVNNDVTVTWFAKGIGKRDVYYHSDILQWEKTTSTQL